ncbi:hypothetical protein ASL20_31970 [Cupriavidus necator]|nr:hypothetical protein ASL20_31970 [Cupriavidus necator]
MTQNHCISMQPAPRSVSAPQPDALLALRQRCDSLARQLARCASADERHMLLLQLARCGADMCLEPVSSALRSASTATKLT